MRDREAAAGAAAVQRDAGLLAAAGAAQEHGQVLSGAPHQRACEAHVAVQFCTPMASLFCCVCSHVPTGGNASTCADGSCACA